MYGWQKVKTHMGLCLMRNLNALPHEVGPKTGSQIVARQHQCSFLISTSQYKLNGQKNSP